MSYQLMESLGIELVSKEKERVVMSMPVDERTHQPHGFLHGGASVLLAETAASVGGSLHIDLEREAVFGIEINANHVKSKQTGVVTAIATPLHVGKSTMVWEIWIEDEQDELVSISRCTLAVVRK